MSIKKRKLKKRVIIISFIIILVVFFLIINLLKRNSPLKIKLLGNDVVRVEVGGEYKEPGYTATYKKIDLSKKVEVKGKYDVNKLGEYELTYKIKYKNRSSKTTRKIIVQDKTKPELILESGDIIITVGSEYKEPGYKAIDNYDGDITKKVKTKNNIDSSKEGDYEVTYTVEDSHKNKKTIKRSVKVLDKSKVAEDIAVLNYHFFYDPNLNEVCNESICEKVSDFKSHLDYFKENNFKTLTMQEFRDWMYGITELPLKSVLITVDDGAMGTGTHNGNKLIPILEEYKMHATLFLITGWWDINNYKSPYLDIQSHTNDMHKGGMCSGVSRGAQMLCSSDEEVRNDLKKSIDITKSKLSFCFPFYAYDDRTISLVKEAGFDLAFIGGNTKANRSKDKYHIPRYPIRANTTMQEVINYVN